MPGMFSFGGLETILSISAPKIPLRCIIPIFLLIVWKMGMTYAPSEIRNLERASGDAPLALFIEHKNLFEVAQKKKTLGDHW